jgi:hypothetical protein
LVARRAAAFSDLVFSSSLLNDVVVVLKVFVSLEIFSDKSEDIGTTIILHLNDEGKEFASRWKIQSTVKKYSDHIDFPIFLSYEDTEYDDDGKEKGKTPKTEQVNDATAFWKRPKNELKKKAGQLHPSLTISVCNISCVYILNFFINGSLIYI